KTKSANLVATSQPVERTFRAAGFIVRKFQQFADRALALGAAIRNDIKDPTVTQVTGTIAGHAYVADFSAFDIDGDGTADGSGKINETPVAMRMWVSTDQGYQRFLCALVTTRPTTSNVGAGQVY